MFFPAPNEDAYYHITGFDGFSQCKDTLEFLLANQAVTLNCPVQTDTIQELPEIYDIAVSKNVPLMIHYDPDLFTRESRQYIRRFNRMKNVTVLQHRPRNGKQCQVVPIHMQVPSSNRKIYFKETMNRIRHKIQI